MANKRPKPEEIVTKLRQVEVLTGQGMWSCHACVPVSQLIYAAFRSNAKGLLPPNDEV